jgi:quinol-cytochrome oxidoreductase complex cytochrome b subunit
MGRHVTVENQRPYDRGMEMNSETCQLLATVLSLVMVTLVVERRSMRMPLRRRTWFRNGMLSVFTASLIGLGILIAGTQAAGLTGAWSVMAWMFCSVSIVGLGVVILASMASSEADEDEGTDLVVSD